MMMPYARITPYTSPDCFTKEEKAMYDASQCGYQIAYGLPWTVYCKKPSAPGADFGHCQMHAAQVAEEEADRKAAGL